MRASAAAYGKGRKCSGRKEQKHVCVCVRPVVEIGGSRNALVTNEELVERKHERVSDLRRGRLVSSTGGDFFALVGSR